MRRDVACEEMSSLNREDRYQLQDITHTDNAPLRVEKSAFVSLRWSELQLI